MTCGAPYLLLKSNAKLSANSKINLEITNHELKQLNYNLFQSCTTVNVASAAIDACEDRALCCSEDRSGEKIHCILPGADELMFFLYVRSVVTRDAMTADRGHDILERLFPGRNFGTRNVIFEKQSKGNELFCRSGEWRVIQTDGRHLAPRRSLHRIDFRQ